MKRYVSHFLLLPQYGYLKEYIVETEHGFVIRLLPFNGEMESTEWISGVIALLPESNNMDHIFTRKSIVLEKLPLKYSEGHISETLFRAYSFSPFNFTLMQPVCGTQHKQLP